MPSFDYINANHNKPDDLHSATYSKVYSYFVGAGSNTALKIHKAAVHLKTSEAYHNSLLELTNDEYQNAAGADLASIFFPYQTTLGNGIGEMPSFVPSFQTAT